MRLMLTAAASSLALVLSPISAIAQTPEATAPAPAPASAPVEKSAEELAVEAKATALREALVKMQDELVAAWPDGDSDAIIAPYRVQANDMAEAVDALLSARAEAASDADTRAALQAEAAANVPKIRALPDFVAQTVLRALANPKPAPTAPAD